MVGEPEARITLSADVSKAISQINRLGGEMDRLISRNLIPLGQMEGAISKIGDTITKIKTGKFSQIAEGTKGAATNLGKLDKEVLASSGYFVKYASNTELMDRAVDEFNKVMGPLGVSIEKNENKFGSLSKRMGDFGKKISSLGGKMSMLGWRVGLMGLIMMFAGQQIIRMLQGVMKTSTQFLTEMADMQGGLKKVTQDLISMAIGGQLGGSAMAILENNLNGVTGIVPKAQGELASINQYIYSLKLAILEAALPHLEKLKGAFKSLAEDEKFKTFLKDITDKLLEKVVPAIINLMNKLKDPEIQEKLKKLAGFLGDVMAKFIEGVPELTKVVDLLDKFKGPIKFLVDKLPLLIGIFTALFLPLYLLGPVMQLVGTAISGIGTALGVVFGEDALTGVSNIDKFKGGFNGLVGLLANPITWAGIVVAGIALSAYLVSQGEDINSFNKKASEIFKGVDKAITDAVEGFMKTLDNFTEVDLERFVVQTLAIFGRMSVLVLAVLVRLSVALLAVLGRMFWAILTGLGKFVLDSIARIGKWGDEFFALVVKFGESIRDEMSKMFNKYIIEPLQNMISDTLGFFSGWRISAVGIITGFGTDIEEKVQWVKDQVIGVFNSLWTGALKIWEDIKSGILRVWEGIWGGIKGFINLIIGGINQMIGALNSIKFKFPDWIPFIGGKDFGLNIPLIPTLAEGGVINSPTLAMLGEAGPEAVVPLNRGSFGGATTVNIIFPNLTGEISDAQIEKIRRVIASEFRSRSRVVF